MNTLKDFIENEDGMGVVEIILIIVVLIGVVIIFSNQIKEIVQDIFDKIKLNVKSVN